MQADAIIAWGVDFGDPSSTSVGFSFQDVDWDLELDLDELFGFTEDYPAGNCSNSAEHRVWLDTILGPWKTRRDTAVPLEAIGYGYEQGGTALVLKRSHVEVEWGSGEVDPACVAPPTVRELSAFARVWSAWKIEWPADVKLLLMAAYY